MANAQSEHLVLSHFLSEWDDTQSFEQVLFSLVNWGSDVVVAEPYDAVHPLDLADKMRDLADKVQLMLN